MPIDSGEDPDNVLSDIDLPENTDSDSDNITDARSQKAKLYKGSMRRIYQLCPESQGDIHMTLTNITPANAMRITSKVEVRKTYRLQK